MFLDSDTFFAVLPLDLKSSIQYVIEVQSFSKKKFNKIMSLTLRNAGLKSFDKLT